MPTAPIVVDTDVYGSAAELFLRVNDAVCDVVGAAATAAGAGGGMAGTDSGGVAWARRYDEAAAAALRTGAALADALGHLGERLDRSGANHADAEIASAPGGPPVYPGGGGAPGAASIGPAVPPSANGTDDDPPAGWFLVAHLLEYTWPNGHQDRLRAVGAGWRDTAAGLTAAADRLSGPIGDVSALQSPEVDAAVTTCCQVQQSARSLSQQCGALGEACVQYAGHLDDAHTQVVAELVEFAAESAVLQLVAAVAAVPTAGGSEVAGQTAQVARTALAASRIAGFLAKLIELVATLTETVADVAVQVVQVQTQLQAVLETGALAAAAAAVPTLPAVVPYDLDADEGKGRGHTIEEHVGKSDQYLIGRNKKLASTFVDLPTAESATALNINAHQAEIQAWLAGSDLKMDFTSAVPGLTGRVYDKATGTFLPPTTVTTVLRRISTGYFVLTSYPNV